MHFRVSVNQYASAVNYLSKQVEEFEEILEWWVHLVAQGNTTKI